MGHLDGAKNLFKVPFNPDKSHFKVDIVILGGASVLCLVSLGSYIISYCCLLFGWHTKRLKELLDKVVNAFLDFVVGHLVDLQSVHE